MQQQNRRYIFLDFGNLRKVRFKKLEKVASKIFVFVNKAEESVPFQLVRQTQKLGKNLRWVVVEKPKNNCLNLHIAFVMGKLHQKVHPDIEFGILTNDKDFDALIKYINSDGRSCLRVKRKKASAEKTNQTKATNKLEEALDALKEPIHSQPSDRPVTQQLSAAALLENNFGDSIIEKTAEETIQRLIRSGNRPAQVKSLKNYILLHNQELSLYGNVDRIIQKLEADKEIEIKKEGVIYHF